MNKPFVVDTTYNRVVCKGSMALGTGCGVCEICLMEKQGMADTNPFPDYHKPSNCVKPPLGLRSRFIWLEGRKKEIIEALQRQLEEGENLNGGWVDELKEINEMMEEKQ